jgi:hypothetical protein
MERVVDHLMAHRLIDIKALSQALVDFLLKMSDPQTASSDVNLLSWFFSFRLQVDQATTNHRLANLAGYESAYLAEYVALGEGWDAR